MDEERKQKANYLTSMMSSPGGQILFKHINEEIQEGWDKFIDLPVEKKTSKAAYDAQARYKALKAIREWVDEEIKAGQ